MKGNSLGFRRKKTVILRESDCTKTGRDYDATVGVIDVRLGKRQFSTDGFLKIYYIITKVRIKIKS